MRGASRLALNIMQVIFAGGTTISVVPLMPHSFLFRPKNRVIAKEKAGSSPAGGKAEGCVGESLLKETAVMKVMRLPG